MTYILHYHGQDAPQQFSEADTVLLFENNFENEQVRADKWAELQAGKKVSIRAGYVMRGDLN